MHNLSFLGNQYLLNDLIFPVGSHLSVLRKEKKEIADIVGEEPGRRRRQLSGYILYSLDGNPVLYLSCTGSRDSAVTALVNGISTIAEPGFIEATISSVRRTGAS